MYGGRLLEVADTQVLFGRPEHPYTRALLAANPAAAPRGTRLPVIPAEWSVETLEQAERAREPTGPGDRR
jgi:ABC-type dipeptide/oligopeptide/nickel transport system ATPase component